MRTLQEAVEQRKIENEEKARAERERQARLERESKDREQAVAKEVLDRLEKDYGMTLSPLYVIATETLGGYYRISIDGFPPGLHCRIDYGSELYRDETGELFPSGGSQLFRAAKSNYYVDYLDLVDALVYCFS